MKMRLFISLMVLAVLPFSSFAQDGGCGGHGGDGISLEFFQIAQSLEQRISSLSEEQLSKINRDFSPAMLRTALKRTRISSTDRALEREIHGVKQKVDALNSIENNQSQILVNRARWLQYSKNRFAKTGVVLHEYLGIVKSLFPQSGEWDEYTLSVELIAELSEQNSTDLQKNSQWIALIENEFKKSKPVSEKIPGAIVYSCVERSMISEVPGAVIKKNYLTTRELNEYKGRFTTQDVRIDSALTQERRINAQQDLVIKTSTVTDKNQLLDVSLMYCSRIDSAAIQMLDLAREENLAGFDVINHPAMVAYYTDLKAFYAEMEKYGCVDSTKRDMDVIACMGLLNKLNDLKPNLPTTSRNTLLGLQKWYEGIPQPSARLTDALRSYNQLTLVVLDRMENIIGLKSERPRTDKGFNDYLDELLDRAKIMLKKLRGTYIADVERVESTLLEQSQPDSGI